VFVFVDLRKERKSLEEELCSADFVLPTALQECSDSCTDLALSDTGRQSSLSLRYQLHDCYFYRATRMHSADYTVTRCLSIRPSVCHTPVFCQNG